MPCALLPEMTLPAPAAVPPMVLSVAPLMTNTPKLPLPSAAVPAALVPMKLPSTTLPVVPLPVMSMPSLVLPLMTLPAAAVVPPMVLLLAPLYDVARRWRVAEAAVPAALVPM